MVPTEDQNIIKEPITNKEDQTKPDENNGADNNYYLQMGYDKDKGSMYIKKVDTGNSTESTTGSANNNSNTYDTNTGNSEAPGSAIGAAAGNAADNNYQTDNANVGNSETSGPGSAVGEYFALSTETQYELKQIIYQLNLIEAIGVTIAILPIASILTSKNPTELVTNLYSTKGDLEQYTKLQLISAINGIDNCVTICARMVDDMQMAGKDNEYKLWYNLEAKFQNKYDILNKKLNELNKLK